MAENILSSHSNLSYGQTQLLIFNRHKISVRYIIFVSNANQ